MAQDDSFFEGDQAIRKRVQELATASGLGVETIDRIAGSYSSSDHEYFVYGLRGTTKSVTLRASEIRLSAHPVKLAERIEPRLKAMFEEMWWQKAVILMGRNV